MRTLQRLTFVVAIFMVTGFTATAVAAPIKPSQADTLTLGVPYTNSMDGEGSGNAYHWLKLPATIRNGDVLQFSATGSEPTRVCLAPAVDDADRLDTEEDCATNGYSGDLPHVDIDGTRRRTLTWSGPAGVGFLLVASGDCCPYLNNGTYTLTLEQIIPNVLIGMPPPPVLNRVFQLVASLQLGDNTPAGDGITGELQWKKTRKTPGLADWTTLASAVSVAGQLTFSGQVPVDAQRRILLRACALRPGGGLNCTGVSNVALNPPETGECRAAVKRSARFRKRLKRLSRQGRRKGVAIVKRRLRKSERAVQKHCVGSLS